jgi:hypothetical protein
MQEGCKGQEKRSQRRQPSPTSEPSHRELRQARVKVGRAVCDYKKGKAMGFPPRRSPRVEAGAFMERGKPLTVLYLTKL